MPSYAFTQSVSGDLETCSVLDPGTETYVDADGITKERALDPVSVTNVDLQPASGRTSLMPEGVRSEAEQVAYVDLSSNAAAKRAALLAGRTIQDASGNEYVIGWVGDWTTHIVLALAGKK